MKKMEKNKMIEKELENFILGKQIGSGIHRIVYECLWDEALVVKVAIDDDARAVNLLEEKLWLEIAETPVAKWFTPVVGCSQAGKYLLERRVEKLPKEQYPKEIPHFFTDTKYSNFGWLKGKGFVCCDYGTFNIFKGLSTKMKSVEWWE